MIKQKYDSEGGYVQSCLCCFQVFVEACSCICNVFLNMCGLNIFYGNSISYVQTNTYINKNAPPDACSSGAELNSE